MINKRQSIMLGPEVTLGVDPVLSAATDGLRVTNIASSFDGARSYNANSLKRTLGKEAPIFGGTLRAISFDVEVKGSGVAGTPPEAGNAYLGCGMAETINVAVDVRYKFASTLMGSSAIYHYEDGLKYVLLGSRGIISGVGAVGNPMITSMAFVGHLVGPIDEAMPVITYNATRPPVMLGVPVLLGGANPRISSLSWNSGSELAKPGDMSAADGYDDIEIADRNVTGAIDPRATLVAVNDWVADWKASAPKALTTGVVGAVAGNQFQLDFPVITYMEIGTGDRDKIITRDIGFQASEVAGDDELELIFT